MNKQGILTILGVIFSLIIVFLGWILTNMLLDKQDIDILATTGRVYPPTASERKGQRIDEKSDVNIDTITDSVIAGEKLDKNSIINMSKILVNWNNPEGYAKPHEPMKGQLNMEQALAMAEAGLSYFSIHGIIPEELLQDEFTEIDASLCVNLPRKGVVAEFPPEYSYWIIGLSNEKMNVRLKINAVTGAMWDIGVYSMKEEIQLTSLNAIEILDIYTKYLGLEDEDSVRYNEALATKGFFGNVLQVTAVKKGNAAYKEMDYISLSISSTRQIAAEAYKPQ